jgi:NADH-quinone oxidoreductase subunit L
MGGLRKIMPYTFFAYLIAGISSMGVPFTSGFYSKDLIIDIFKNNGNSFIYYSLIAGVFITTLYTSKIFFKVFFGDNKLKIEDSTELEHKDVILMPLIALAIPSMFIGLALFDSMLFNNYFSSSTSDFNIVSNFYNNYIISAFSFTVHAFTSLSFFVLVIGVITSYLIYYKEIDLSKIFEGKLSLIKKILESEYGFINLSNNYIPLYFKKIANILWIKSDVNIIDNLIVNGIANQIKKISTRIRLIQTGYIYHYAFTMIIGLMLFLLVFFNF